MRRATPTTEKSPRVARSDGHTSRVRPAFLGSFVVQCDRRRHRFLSPSRENVTFSSCMNVQARPRWSASQPGRQKRAAASHLQQNPRRWRSAIRQGDHTQPEELSSEMRSRGVVLTASRISVPSPATPCTLITPNGAPHGPISDLADLLRSCPSQEPMPEHAFGW